MENQRIPKSEVQEVKGLSKYLYKAMDWLGLTSGIGLVTWGAWWFIWSMVNYFTSSPLNEIHQIIQENYFNQAQLSAILVALGIVIMEIKKLKDES